MDTFFFNLALLLGQEEETHKPICGNNKLKNIRLPYGSHCVEAIVETIEITFGFQDFFAHLCIYLRRRFLHQQRRKKIGQSLFAW